MKTNKKRYISFGLDTKDFEKSNISKAKASPNAIAKAMVANYHMLPAKYRKDINEIALKSGVRNIPMSVEQEKAFDSIKNAFDLKSKTGNENDLAALRCALRKAGIVNLTLNNNG